jgi:MoxR-like ATPase
MEYQKYFDYKTGKPEKKVAMPKSTVEIDGEGEAKQGSRPGDRRDGLVYVYDDKIELAVNVALATGRPMLVRGPSGSGKSSMARNIARRLGWRYYERVITSRTQASDLQWTFESLKRLSDAQANRLNPETAYYVEPGVLWWAFDPASARRRGMKEDVEPENPAVDPGEETGTDGAVILLDEIDKADPDVPNNLLVPLGSLEFIVRETGAKIVAKRPVLVVITTNDERVLPNAFLRRCVILELEAPGEELLVRIATEHYGEDVKNIYRPIASRVIEMSPKKDQAKGSAAKAGAAAAMPSTAEYLDTVRACLELDVNPTNEAHKEAWQAITAATLTKRATPA